MCAGLAVLGSRKKENLCLKVDKALGTMLPSAGDETAVTEDAAVVGAAKKAARTVITILMSAYKHPEVHYSANGSLSSSAMFSLLFGPISFLEC